MQLRAIYRLQVTPRHGFAAVRAALPYLRRLGISHLYLSPIFRSRPGSEHGYDVVDHGSIDPELGGETGFRQLVADCREHGMGIVLDIVPNHMAVMSPDNAWWLDVLENGAASRFADFFDIDWTPARPSMRNRLLVPALAEPLGEVIDRHGIRLQFDAARGSFAARHESLSFPLDPRTYPRLFRMITQLRGQPPGQAVRSQLGRLLDAFAALPPTQPCPTEIQLLRAREVATLQKSLAALCAAHADFAPFVHEALQALSTAPAGQQMEQLYELLAAQPWRLAYWRVSGEEINYRRFFDVNDLAALRMEERRVFDATHALVSRLWDEGDIDGVRVDHADGLYDPAQYFHRLRHLLASRGGRGPWIVVEKILGRNEPLPRDWQVDGTTGYEFAALATGWLMHERGAAALERTFQRLRGAGPDYAQIAYRSRKQVMHSLLAAEISGLAARLDRLAQQHHNTTDFTLFDLRAAIVEVAACFPVYRTYIRGDGHPGSEDVRHVRRAVGMALSRKVAPRRALEFLERVLLGELAAEGARRAAAVEFTLKFQQVTAPVMAKGIEDTAYYRYPSLLAANEVGADPLCRGIAIDVLHQANLLRQREYPRSVLATSTHDTKRGEDARWRLCVLTELNREWAACLARWRRLRGRRRSARAIGASMEYLLLQSLLAIWPVAPSADPLPELRQRLVDYAIKAAREAKERTSWLDPDAGYEESLRAFVALLLPESGDAGFHAYFHGVIEPVAYFGMLNALGAVVLKLTCPGVPDIYQGNELPQLVLVDPDNRRQPDYALHATLLDEVARAAESPTAAVAAADMLHRWQDGRLKLFTCARLLALRQAWPELFAAGDYTALQVEGPAAAHLCAFARGASDLAMIVVVSRWAATLARGALSPPLGEATWGDTQVLLPQSLPAGEYVDVLTGHALRVDDSADTRTLRAAALLQVLPFTVRVCTAPARTAAASDP